MPISFYSFFLEVERTTIRGFLCVSTWFHFTSNCYMKNDVSGNGGISKRQQTMADFLPSCVLHARGCLYKLQPGNELEKGLTYDIND